MAPKVHKATKSKMYSSFAYEEVVHRICIRWTNQLFFLPFLSNCCVPWCFSICLISPKTVAIISAAAKPGSLFQEDTTSPLWSLVSMLGTKRKPGQKILGFAFRAFGSGFQPSCTVLKWYHADQWKIPSLSFRGSWFFTE